VKILVILLTQGACVQGREIDGPVPAIIAIPLPPRTSPEDHASEVPESGVRQFYLAGFDRAPSGRRRYLYLEH
jgi:hypothetical protein